MPVSIHLLLADHLAARIQAGHYPPGTCLPSAHDLEHEGYPVRSARDALRRLAREGWVELQEDGSYLVTGETQDVDWALVNEQVESLMQAWQVGPPDRAGTSVDGAPRPGSILGAGAVVLAPKEPRPQ